VTGHLFQARFSSVVVDEEHLMAAARYVAMNPVRARLAARPEDWAWSSARAHLSGLDDRLVEVRRSSTVAADVSPI
jgi:putative transposase